MLAYEDIEVGGGGPFTSPYSILPAPASDPRLAGRRASDIRNVGNAVGIQPQRTGAEQDPFAMGRMARYTNQFQVPSQELAGAYSVDTNALADLEDYFGLTFHPYGSTSDFQYQDPYQDLYSTLPVYDGYNGGNSPVQGFADGGMVQATPPAQQAPQPVQLGNNPSKNRQEAVMRMMERRAQNGG